VGTQVVPVSIRILAGPERDAAFRDVVVAQVPRFGKYEGKSGRSMPLALLTPLR
jgi:hypothetical protein